MMRSLVLHNLMMNTAQLILDELLKDFPSHYSVEDKLECIHFYDWLDFVLLIGL